MMATPARRAVTVRDIYDAVDSIAPFELAEEWDNVGLQIGDPKRPAGRVMVALEVSDAVIAEAKRSRIGTLVTHHPLIFRPLKNVKETSPVTRMMAELIRANIALIAAHTNLDSVALGTNGEIADRLGLINRDFLQPNESSTNVKYAVFVPVSHVDAVIEAIAGCGAGVIGNYSHCTFRTPGTGTFKPLPGSNSYAGDIGRLEHATDEVKLEAVCPKDKLEDLLAAVRGVHPYEEIAFDVFPLLRAGRASAGLGLYGDLQKAMDFKKLLGVCKKTFGIASIGGVGDMKRSVRRVAICSGSGGSLITAAEDVDADVLVTGEMTHHQCAEARDRGLNAILVGHFDSEVIVCPRLARMLSEHDTLKGRITVVVSKAEKAPLVRV